MHKIIFTGPVGVGKTTAINAISDIPTVSTEQVSTAQADNKTHTTVALDYGMIRLNNGECIHIYGTPGQGRFNFMWKILSEGGLGLVMLMDNSRDNPFDDLHFYYNEFKSFIAANALIVGITHMEDKKTPTISDYHEQLRRYHINPPIFEVDGRNRDDIRSMIQALMYTLDIGIVDLDSTKNYNH
ncbi:MAG: GTP-binding protein [Gammaproteobacteria bacterium]|nr:GTP-binding protein [Gammaproteobacteria bacterium]